MLKTGYMQTTDMKIVCVSADFRFFPDPRIFSAFFYLFFYIYFLFLFLFFYVFFYYKISTIDIMEH